MILALDISKRSCGWALLSERGAAADYGHFVLGSEFTSPGQTYVKLHQELSDLRALTKYERIYYEEALNPAALSGHTNIDTLRVLAGLVAHVESFAHAMRCNTHPIHVATWRRFFIGNMPRGTKTRDWKDYSIERCRQYGWRPRNDDEADALGLLDFACDQQGFVPAWRANEVLRGPIGRVA